MDRLLSPAIAATGLVAGLLRNRLPRRCGHAPAFSRSRRQRRCASTDIASANGTEPGGVTAHTSDTAITIERAAAGIETDRLRRRDSGPYPSILARCIPPMRLRPGLPRRDRSESDSLLVPATTDEWRARPDHHEDQRKHDQATEQHEVVGRQQVRLAVDLSLDLGKRLLRTESQALQAGEIVRRRVGMPRCVRRHRMMADGAMIPQRHHGGGTETRADVAHEAR